jgi:hypothetical protein
MLTFISIFAAGVAALLGAQHLDIECANPRTPAKIAPPKPAIRPNFDGVVTQ